jgi:hypothetical protein
MKFAHLFVVAYVAQRPEPDGTSPARAGVRDRDRSRHKWEVGNANVHSAPHSQSSPREQSSRQVVRAPGCAVTHGRR